MLALFLLEAATLSILGGLIGMALGLAGAAAIVKILEIPFIFIGSIALIAFAFSAAVGAVFGYFPARKAANLDPIEALRYE